MKEYFSLRRILLIAGLALGLLAFFICFGAGLTYTSHGETMNVSGMVIGTPMIHLGGESAKATAPWDVRAVLSLVGLIIFAVCLFVNGLVGLLAKKRKLALAIVMGILMVVASVFIWLLQVNFAASVLVKYPGAEKEIEQILTGTKLNACTVISALSMMLSAGMIIAANSVKEKAA